MVYAKAFIATLLSFTVIDLVWINLVVLDYYGTQVGHLLRETPDLKAAAAFYLLYIGGIVILAVKPALATKKLGHALFYGAVLGAVAYGTYTVTNYSVFADWTLGLVVSDVAWGTLLTSVAAACGYLAART